MKLSQMRMPSVGGGMMETDCIALLTDWKRKVCVHAIQG